MEGSPMGWAIAGNPGKARARQSIPARIRLAFSNIGITPEL